jgi:hypothetical protein
MSQYFTKINCLPCLDLKTELDYMLETQKINWINDEQICINCTNIDCDDFSQGAGSLTYDWSKKTTIKNENGKEELYVPKRSNRLKETDFKFLCTVFKNTLFETIYLELQKYYELGRIRIMKSKPKTCLSWHYDLEKRLHYPMETQEGCFMIIDHELKHLPKYQWCLTDTTAMHTAVNSSKEERIHLVACILGEH